MKFLKAQWRNLILVNYEIEPDLLKPYIPKGTQIDFYNNKCYISLVGFMFLETTVLGAKFPFHINFEEVNLRFYVTHNEKRGTVFIKEIVPKSIITFIANSLYKEHYQTCKMNHKWEEKEDHNYIEYGWEMNNKWQSISVNSEKTLCEIQPNSSEEFITEHYFGYTKHNNKTFEYEVEHPKWKHFKVNDFVINVDFTSNYGEQFKFLNNKKPVSIIHANGSEIVVRKKVQVV